jgi:histidine triad (HIT) family protein
MKCIFCEFIAGKTTHKNGFPFIPIKTTKKTISFLSIDFPAHEDGHLLVIPKRHYQSIKEVPPKILTELITHVKRAAKVLQKRHHGTNILLNDGKAAGQVVPHLHFHVIPRDKNDNIKIEVWKEKKLSVRKFIKLSNKLKKQF